MSRSYVITHITYHIEKRSLRITQARDRGAAQNVLDRTVTEIVHAYVYINLLKPTGHVMHQQFNIQQLYALHTLYLCVMYLSEKKQRLVPLTA